MAPSEIGVGGPTPQILFQIPEIMPNDELTTEQHRARHVALHQALDELLADFIVHTRQMPSVTTLKDLMEWSHQQTIDPTE